LRIVRIDNYRDFLDLRETWNDTLERCSDNNIFSTWEWLTLWWKHFGEGRQLMILLAENGSKTVGIAPIMCSAYRLFGIWIRKIEFIGSGASDYCSFILAEKHDECMRLFSQYVSRLPEEWDYVELTDVSEKAGWLGALKAMSGSTKLAQRAYLHECSYIPISVSQQEYLDSLSTRQKKNLRRNARNLEKDFTVEYLDSSKTTSFGQEMNFFFDLHQKRWTAKRFSGIFSSQQARDFHVDVARSFSQQGWLGLFFLKLSGIPAAVLYGFRYNSKFYYYLSGYHPRFSRYGVGSLLTQHVVNVCIKEGLKEFDFLRGSEDYKNRWNTSSRWNLQLVLTRKGFLPLLRTKWYVNWWLFANKIKYFSRNLLK